jgi:predicted GIY-YIG superfamily endonuclease
MSGFSYVYVLESQNEPGRHYVGLTDNLGRRLKRHNAGAVSHTSRFAPWSIRAAVAFRSRHQASAFELYLKSHSGRIFAKKWF